MLGRARGDDARLNAPRAQSLGRLQHELASVHEEQRACALVRRGSDHGCRQDGLARVVRDCEVVEEISTVPVEREPVEVLRIWKPLDGEPSPEHVFLLLSLRGSLASDPARNDVRVTGDADAVVGSAVPVLASFFALVDVCGQAHTPREERYVVRKHRRLRDEVVARAIKRSIRVDQPSEYGKARVDVRVLVRPWDELLMALDILVKPERAERCRNRILSAASLP